MADITKLPLFVIREMWLDGELSDADYTAEVQRRNDEILSLRSRAEKAEAERDELHSWTKTITTAISDTVGLGSEMFRRHGEQYRIDPAFVAGYIRDRREDHHNSMYRNIRRIRELQATCEKLAKAMELAKDHSELEDEILDIVDEALSAYRNVTTVNASGPKGETPENCRDGGADADPR